MLIISRARWRVQESMCMAMQGRQQARLVSQRDKPWEVGAPASQQGDSRGHFKIKDNMQVSLLRAILHRRRTHSNTTSGQSQMSQRVDSEVVSQSRPRTSTSRRISLSTPSITWTQHTFWILTRTKEPTNKCQWTRRTSTRSNIFKLRTKISRCFSKTPRRTSR